MKQLGPPRKYSKEQMEVLIKDKKDRGVSIQAACEKNGWPRVSIYTAIHNYGLKIPRTYSEAKKKNAS